MYDEHKGKISTPTPPMLNFWVGLDLVRFRVWVIVQDSYTIYGKLINILIFIEFGNKMNKLDSFSLGIWLK